MTYVHVWGVEEIQAREKGDRGERGEKGEWREWGEWGERGEKGEWVGQELIFRFTSFSLHCTDVTNATSTGEHITHRRRLLAPTVCNKYAT